jgi:hypothetical protein
VIHLTDTHKLIEFDFIDLISGNEAPVQNVDENISLHEFLTTLEQSGFGPFSELNRPRSYIEVDGKFTIWDEELRKESLASLGITDGTHVAVGKEQLCGVWNDQPIPKAIIGSVQSIPEINIGPIQPLPEIMIGPIQPIPQPIIGYDNLSDLALLRIVLLSNLRMSAYTRPKILTAIEETRKKGGVIMSLSDLMRKAVLVTPLGEIPRANFVLTCSEKKGLELALHLLHSNPKLGELDSDLNVFEMINTICKECGQKFIPNYNLQN